MLLYYLSSALTTEYLTMTEYLTVTEYLTMSEYLKMTDDWALLGIFFKNPCILNFTMIVLVGSEIHMYIYKNWLFKGIKIYNYLNNINEGLVTK